MGDAAVLVVKVAGHGLYLSEFSPNHFVDYAHVTLDDADNLGGDVFVHVVGHGNAGVAVLD